MELTFDHNKILKKIAKERLSPYDIKQRGNSRTFLYDNGWYVIMIEFQPLSGRQGSYLNIGADLNFYPRDYIAFSYGDREKGFEEATDESQFTTLINHYCDYAIKCVKSYKNHFKDLHSAKNYIKKQKVSSMQNQLDLAVLNALINNNNKASAYIKKVLKKKAEFNYEYEAQKFAIILADIINKGANKQDFIDIIKYTRQQKKLQEIDINNIAKGKPGLIKNLFNTVFDIK